MSRQVGARSDQAKSARFPKGQRNCPKRQRISPVMQKVRGSLAPVKAAEELHFLTGQPLSICQKVLAGNRVENRAMLAALFQTRLITDVILALTEGVSDPKVRAVRKAVKRVKLEQELARLDQGDDE